MGCCLGSEFHLPAKFRVVEVGDGAIVVEDDLFSFSTGTLAQYILSLYSKHLLESSKDFVANTNVRSEIIVTDGTIDSYEKLLLFRALLEK